MRSVMVTKFLPLPDDSGGRQRSLAIARRLAALGDLVLCAYDDGQADLTGLHQLGIDVRSAPWKPSPTNVARGAVATRSVSAGRFWSAALAHQVRRAVHEAPVDVLQVEYLQMAPYARGLPAGRRVLDLHNIESELVASYGRARRGAAAHMYRTEAALLRHMERRLVGTFDTVVVVSEKERTRLPSGSGPSIVCPNGQDPPTLLPPSTSPVLAFVATMGWAPNVDAACWLGRHIWPKVKHRIPDAVLLLVGRDPAQEVRDLAGPDVEVTGTVASVTPFLQRASVVVAPLLAGGGTRLKITEALGAGRPVVSTTIGADGLEDLIGKGMVIADGVEALVEEICRLLRDPAAAAVLGKMGHEAVTERHTWDAALAPLFELVAP
jgi:glycosyltransferase involved in cell wall biosynthesis